MNDLDTITDDATMEALMAQYSNPVTPLRGTMIKGTVFNIDAKKGAWVDFGGKSEALVPAEELLDAQLSVGQSTMFFVLSVTEEDESCRLSKQWTGPIFSATRAQSWNCMQQHLTDRTNVSVRVTKVARNRTGGIAGLNVVAGELHGFVPYTKLGTAARSLETLVGSQMEVKVDQVIPDLRKLIFNRQVCLAEQLAETLLRRDELFADLTVGDVRSGKVVRLVDYGAFVDVGEGLHGLVHRSEISGDTKVPIAQLIKIGEQVQVKVLRAETTDGKRQLALSIKQLRQAAFLNSIKLGDLLEGTISRLTDFGCFVELSAANGVDGLIHKSQYNSAVRNGRKQLTPQQVVRVKVIEIDLIKGRVGLSLKEVTQPAVDGEGEQTEKLA